MTLRAVHRSSSLCRAVDWSALQRGKPLAPARALLCDDYLVVVLRSCSGLHPLAGHKGALAQSRHHHRNAIAAYGRTDELNDACDAAYAAIAKTEGEDGELELEYRDLSRNWKK